MDTTGIIAYSSRINPDFQVFVVYSDSEQYSEIHEYLTKLNNSIGALMIGTKSIFIDGERVTDDCIDVDQLLAIEAHEIAHSMLGHEGGVDESAEKEADLLAVTLLDMDGYTRASGFLKDRLNDLYGIDYRQFEVEFEDELKEEENDK
jgi:hypothetical protein